MKKIIFLLLIPLLFVACKSHNEIPFYEAKNYFIRNDIQNSVPVKFENEKDFKEYFGMAAVMGKDGMPTSIDFTKQYVIAVTLPETDTETDINLVSLKKDTNSDIILTYKVITGEKRSYTIVPVRLLIVDKKYDGTVKLIRQE